jgi:hypothetical protein
MKEIILSLPRESSGFQKQLGQHQCVKKIIKVINYIISLSKAVWALFYAASTARLTYPRPTCRRSLSGSLSDDAIPEHDDPKLLAPLQASLEVTQNGSPLFISYSGAPPRS